MLLLTLIALNFPTWALGAPVTSNPSTDDAAALETLQVTGSRVEQPVGEATATVAVIDSAQIERRVADDLKALIRYEPGVSVRNQPDRFGQAGFNIRGLEGNRVLVLVDGVRTADGFAIGSFSNATRGGIDLAMLEQVEILKGPASSLYGSSALGGVVAFTTRSARSFLDGADGIYTAARLLHSSANDATDLAGTLAMVDGRWSMLALASANQASETETMGDNRAPNATRTVANPQQIEGRAVLGKLALQLDDASELSLHVDAHSNDSQTEVLTAVRTQNFGPTQIRTLAQQGDDRQQRVTTALAFERDSAIGFVDTLRLQLAHQQSSIEQFTTESRESGRAGSPFTPARVARDFYFDQEQQSLSAVFRSRRDWAGASHDLVYGLDLTNTRTAQRRDGSSTNLNSGVTSSFVSPDNFPVRDFPLSSTFEWALFVQDEIRFGDSRWALIPGLRYDRYELEPRLDPIFAADNPGITPVGLEASELSAKLGLRLEITDAWSVAANYAEGFRAPPYSDANLGFTNLQFGYTAIPNPDLKPETNQSLELSTQWRGDGAYVRFATYYSEYEDFIESLLSLGVDPQSGLLVFQSENLTAVSIKGAELRGSFELDTLTPALAGFSVDAGLGWAWGEDHALDVPLASIDPARAVIGLRYAPADARYSVELVGTGVQRKNRTDDRFGAQFRPGGYGLIDLYAEYRLGDRARINVGAFNLADRKVWDWADVRGRSASDPAIDRYTRPGLSFAVSFRIDY